MATQCRQAHYPFIVTGVDIGVNNTKVPRKCNNGFPWYCCPATKHFVLQLTIICIKYYTRARVCVCIRALAGMQSESFLRSIYSVMCDLSGSKHSSTLSHKWHDFRKKKLLNIKSCFSLYFVKNISNFKNNSAKYYHKRIHVFNKSTVFSSDFSGR